MITDKASLQRRREAAKDNYRILIMILAISFKTAVGFGFQLPLRSNVLIESSRGNLNPTRSIRHIEMPLILKYADSDDDNTLGSGDGNEAPTTHFPIVGSHNANVRENEENAQKGDTLNEDSAIMPETSGISDAIKEVLTAPVIPSEEKGKERKGKQRLIIPIDSARMSRLVAPKATNTDASKSIGPKSDNGFTRKDSGGKRKIDIRRQWRRLRPGQKFRFRLGLVSIAFVSLWNTVIVRNYNGFITGILTGAAATTTATGFGGILRRWLSIRGFQGIAALGRSLAYGWAIFVAYPRLLDRRAKERRLKREEEAMDQWRRYLRGSADEVVRLRNELSLLEGEIRSFRREILAIRAARIDSSEIVRKESFSTDSGDSNSAHRKNNNDKSDRILREAIINEMSHLTRLRDDTRLALSTARKRWSDVRSKRPISHSKSILSSSFDTLDFELDATPDFEHDRNENDNDDPLLTGF